MKRTRIHYHLDGLIALLLFGVFAVCVLAKTYRHVRLCSLKL